MNKLKDILCNITETMMALIKKIFFFFAINHNDYLLDRCSLNDTVLSAMWTSGNLSVCLYLLQARWSSSAYLAAPEGTVG